jgi:F-type H+-transporting ATPase subunit b
MPRIERILAERQTRISGDIGKATADSVAARALQTEVEASMAAAREKARGLTLNADAAARELMAAKDAALTLEINQRIGNAESRIAASRDAALGAIDQIAADLVSEIVPKLTGKPIADTDALSAVKRVEA